MRCYLEYTHLKNDPVAYSLNVLGKHSDAIKIYLWIINLIRPYTSTGNACMCIISFQEPLCAPENNRGRGEHAYYVTFFSDNEIGQI